MKVIYSAKLIASIVFPALSLVLPFAIYAQAPAGPLPAAPPQPAPPSAAKPQQQTPQQKPRTVILGAWKLNRDESDDARKKMQGSRSSNGGGGYGGRRGGMGGGYPRGPRGGYGGESDQERQKMQELFTPANAITLSMTGAEVDLMDDQNRKRAFITDGRKLQKSKAPNYQEIAAKWEGNRLTTEEKDPRGNKMSRTFELSSDGMQLYETLHMTVGRNSTRLVIRYVYDQNSTARPAN